MGSSQLRWPMHFSNPGLLLDLIGPMLVFFSLYCAFLLWDDPCGPCNFISHFILLCLSQTSRQYVYIALYFRSRVRTSIKKDLAKTDACKSSMQLINWFKWRCSRTKSKPVRSWGCMHDTEAFHSRIKMLGSKVQECRFYGQAKTRRPLRVARSGNPSGLASGQDKNAPLMHTWMAFMSSLFSMSREVLRPWDESKLAKSPGAESPCPGNPSPEHPAITGTGMEQRCVVHESMGSCLPRSICPRACMHDSFPPHAPAASSQSPLYVTPASCMNTQNIPSNPSCSSQRRTQWIASMAIYSFRVDIWCSSRKANFVFRRIENNLTPGNRPWLGNSNPLH